MKFAAVATLLVSSVYSVDGGLPTSIDVYRGQGVSVNGLADQPSKISVSLPEQSFRLYKRIFLDKGTAARENELFFVGVWNLIEKGHFIDANSMLERIRANNIPFIKTQSGGDYVYKSSVLYSLRKIKRFYDNNLLDAEARINIDNLLRRHKCADSLSVASVPKSSVVRHMTVEPYNNPGFRQNSLDIIECLNSLKPDLASVKESGGIYTNVRVKNIAKKNSAPIRKQRWNRTAGRVSTNLSTGLNARGNKTSISFLVN